jgi:hypothetical protein
MCQLLHISAPCVRIAILCLGVATCRSWHLTESVSFYLFYSTLIGAYCWLKNMKTRLLVHNQFRRAYFEKLPRTKMNITL